MVTIWRRLERLPGRLHLDALQTQLTMALMAAATVPLVLAALLSTFSAATETVDAALVDQQILAEALAAYVADYIGLHEAAIVSVARHPALLALEPAAQQDVLQLIRNTLPDIANLSINDASGNQLTSSGYGSLTSIAGLPVFEEVRRTNRSSVQRAVSPVLGAPVVVIGAPIHDPAGQFAGMATGLILPETLNALIARASRIEGAEVYVIDSRDRPVAYTRGALAAERPDLSAMPPVVALRTEPDGEGVVRYDTRDDSRLVGYALVPGLNWGVFVERSAGVVLAGTRTRGLLTLGILVLAIGLAAAVGRRAASWLATPLTGLAQAADRLAEGDQAVILPHSRTREIGRLTLAFGHLHTRLAARTAEVEQAQAELEARVATRTLELQAANTRLQHELAERTRAEQALQEAKLTEGRLEGVRLTARELAHLLNNTLAMPVGAIELIKDNQQVPAHLRTLAGKASINLMEARQHIQQLQQVVRVETKDTVIGPTLDLARSVRPDGPPTDAVGAGRAASPGQQP